MSDQRTGKPTWAELDQMYTRAVTLIAAVTAERDALRSSLTEREAEIARLRAEKAVQLDDEPDWTPEQRQEMQADFDAFVAERNERAAKLEHYPVLEAEHHALREAAKALADKVDRTSECDHVRIACEDIGCIGAEVKAVRAALQSSPRSPKETP